MATDKKRIDDMKDSTSKPFKRKGKKPSRFSLKFVSLEKLAKTNELSMDEMATKIRENPDQFSKTEGATAIAWKEYKKRKDQSEGK